MDSLEFWTDLVFHSPITLLRWSPGRDLLAVVQDSGAVDIFRVPSWTVVFALPAPTDGKSSKACAFSWKPNAQTVAIGFHDGTVAIHSVETGRELYVLRDAKDAPTDIEWVDWKPRNPGYKRPVTLFTELEEIALGPLPGLDSPSSDDYGVPARGSLAIQEDKVESIFFTADAGGHVTLNLAGVLPVGAITITDIFPKQDRPTLLSTWLAPDLSNFAALVAKRTFTEQGHVEDILLLEFCFQLVDADRAPLQRATAHLEHIDRLVNFIAETLQSVEKCWTAIFKLAQKEIGAFETLMEEHSVETGLVLELLNLLLTGVPSTILESYVVQRLHNGQGLKAWQKSFEGPINTVRRVACLRILPGTERLLLHLEALRGLGIWSNNRGTAGFDVDRIAALAETTRNIAFRADRIQLEALEMKVAFAEFSRWLTAVGQGIDTETPLNIEEFDFVKITNYIHRYLQIGPDWRKPTILGDDLPSVDQEAFSAFVAEAVVTIREGRKSLLTASRNDALPSLRMGNSIRLQRRNTSDSSTHQRNILTAYGLSSGHKYCAVILPSGDEESSVDILCLTRSHTAKSADGQDEVAYVRLATDTELPIRRAMDIGYFDEHHLVVLHESLSSDGEPVSELSTYRYEEFDFAALNPQAQMMGLGELDANLQQQVCSELIVRTQVSN
ncbi:Anaphase-promoting complex subunit 4 [Geranomyces michiganensis]|nr:Anaphase-promoting complex subunit 4 [Geranomyces michiganensis]